MEIKALSPLVVVSTMAASGQATLVEFSSNDMGEIKATFTAENVEELNNLKTQFERSPLNDVSVEVDSAKLQLKLSALDS
jgi:hypothetical protein